MELVRNFINVSGLTHTNDIPWNLSGQYIQYSESSILKTPDQKPDIDSIFQIIVDGEIKPGRVIETYNNWTYILDGKLKLKLIYSQKEPSSTANVVCLEQPFNTITELKQEDLDNNSFKLFILDAFFEKLDKRHIYCNILYLIIITTEDKTKASFENASPLLNIVHEKKDEKSVQDIALKKEDKHRINNNINKEEHVDTDAECL